MSPADDRGSSLIIVLIIITVFAVILAATLSFGDTSIRTTVAMRDQASTQYNADGAIQAAINNIRNSSYNGSSGKCFGSNDTLTVPYGSSASAIVNCTTDPNRVRIQCAALTNCNRPGNAILTLGSVPGEDGVNIQQPTGSSFRVHGMIFSNSTNNGSNGSSINVVNGTLTTNTAVYARGACKGNIASTPAKSCNYTTADPRGDDPNYSPEITSPPAYQAMPACTTPNSVVTFSPGYYDDAKALSDMMAGNSPCRGSTWWFQPGNYYFDFHNSGAGSNPVLSALPSNSNVWTINDGCLIAGTPSTASGLPAACGAIGTAGDPIPGACVNPIDTESAVGVQFIFGNDSQLAVKAGQAEICGTYHLDRPPVAVYGLTSGAETATALTGSNTLVLSGAQPSGSYSTPANAATVNTTSADWTATSTSRTGTLNVSGYAPGAVIPAGSNLGTVASASSIKVTHANTNPANNDSYVVKLTPTGADGSTATLTYNVGSSWAGTATGWRTDTVDLVGGSSAFAQFVHAHGYAGAAISYSVTPKNNGTDKVDAIQLDLTYTPPAFRKGAGCVTTGPYTGTGTTSCALVSSINNSGNQLYIQGTTYAPKAAIDLALNNAAEQVFRFGVISRTLWVKETGSFSYGGVVIQVPDDSPGFAFTVYLDAYVCPTSPTCSVGGTPNLRAKVALVDTNPANPTPGTRQVAVLSWSTTR